MKLAIRLVFVFFCGSGRAPASLLSAQVDTGEAVRNGTDQSGAVVAAAFISSSGRADSRDGRNHQRR